MTTPGPRARIELADSSHLYSCDYLYVSVDFGDVAHCLAFTVLDVDCPLILGMPFLRTANPVIDWNRRKVTFANSTAPRMSPGTNEFSSLVADTPLTSSNCSLDATCGSSTVDRSPRPVKTKRVVFDATTVALHECS